MPSYVRARDKEVLDDIIEKLKAIMRERKYSVNKLAAKSYTDIDTVKRTVYDRAGSLKTFARLLDACDAEIIIIKKKKERRFFDVLGAEERLAKLQEYERAAKRKERYQKTKLQKELQRLDDENDFLHDDGGSHEIPGSVLEGRVGGIREDDSGSSGQSPD